MRMKNIMLILFALLVAAGGGIGYTYQAERTPEYALEQLADGVKSRDYDKVKKYADVDHLITTTYDESTAVLADNIQALHETYPQDWFFRHDTAFMKEYIAGRRSDDIVFIQRSLEFYMDPKLMPISRSDGQAKWVSDEMAKFEDSYSAELKTVQKKGKTAIAVFEITGSEDAYGKLVPHLTIEAELEQQADGHWQVVHLANIEDAFYPVVKGIEDYWTMQGWQ
ncbi:hypothetical protein [Selenomonas ruminis]|uniref:Uncharacterized protein n=1 Tax=Selenomonas ruminis TaxID=2593411 RepID=A0A5D6W8N8_9FIRM|nr:hypothetical protein [Selenomonas sp. mPRGC5]TYZ23345.1 hypothetical protein FZ040_05545 [Selenomonas sp. mPRGC5]